MDKICVIGSLNVDITIRLPRFHMPGETIAADSVDQFPGGKGGNQAVAAAKLGKQVTMVGILGDDSYGRFYHGELKRHGIDTNCVGIREESQSGTAFIEVDGNGENRIAIVSGTNGLVNNAYIDSVLDKILECDIFLLQFEIAIETVCYLAEILKRNGKKIILDPAPAAQSPDNLYRNVDFITPNMIELSMLTGMPVESPDDIVKAAQVLLSRGTGAIIAKMGEHGCLYVDERESYHVSGFRVKPVDTTAAGDSFNAGFAVALADGKSTRDALIFANAVGALSTTGFGAQSSMPTFDVVAHFLTALK